MELDSKKIFKTLSPRKVLIPLLFGALATAYIFLYQEGQEKGFHISMLLEADLSWLIAAFLVLLTRDLGYIYRIRMLTDKALSWKSSFYVIVLWEFASAVTPSVVGGTSVAVFLLFKEGIKFGKSLAIVMLSAILDNTFFIIAALIVIIVTKGQIIPEGSSTLFGWEIGVQIIFYISYFLILTYNAIMAYGLFIRPRAFKWMLLKITSIKWLRKWKHAANEQGDEIIMASKLLNGKRFFYWFKASVSTIFIWSARYFIVNCLVSIFSSGLSFFQHLEILAKHLVLWIGMLVSPTPGGSGLAEYLFHEIFGDGLSQYATPINFTWRFITFWLYLLLGIFFMSRWIRKILKQEEERNTRFLKPRG